MCLVSSTQLVMASYPTSFTYRLTLVDIIYGLKLMGNTYELKLLGIIYGLKSIGIHTTNFIIVGKKKLLTLLN